MKAGEKQRNETLCAARRTQPWARRGSCRERMNAGRGGEREVPDTSPSGEGARQEFGVIPTNARKKSKGFRAAPRGWCWAQAEQSMRIEREST